jgi:hypothetical protein
MRKGPKLGLILVKRVYKHMCIYVNGYRFLKRAGTRTTRQTQITTLHRHQIVDAILAKLIPIPYSTLNPAQPKTVSPFVRRVRRVESEPSRLPSE